MNSSYAARVACTLALALIPLSSASAGDKVYVSLTGGTLGIGPEVGYQASEQVAVRANAALLNISRDFSSDDLDYAGKARLKSGGVMVDYFPGGGGFRLSLGARINGNRARAEATPTSAVSINGTSYTPRQVGTLKGELDFKSIAPAVTLGYLNRKGGVTFGVDAGVMLQGRARVKQFTASGGGVAAADLAAERASVQDDVSKFRVYPILQFGIGYRF